MSDSSMVNISFKPDPFYTSLTLALCVVAEGWILKQGNTWKPVGMIYTYMYAHNPNYITIWKPVSQVPC